MAEPEDGPSTGLDEFALIEKYFAPLATDKAALGLTDDAAVLVVPDRQELVVSCDTLVEGVHFLADDPADTVGHKVLAVTLSDLAAKGAKPYAYLLALSLPKETSPEWLAAFASGLAELQRETGVALIGGDTTATPGPLSVTVTGLGQVLHSHVVLRYGAKPGDRLYVTGTIGDAYLGLRLLREAGVAATWGLSEEDAAFLIDRYREPAARTSCALLVRNFAQASIDVSDGLIGDLEKLCTVSGCGGNVHAAAVPLSAAAARAVAKNAALLPELITAGDDYEILLAVAAASAKDFETEAAKIETPVTLIGEITSEKDGILALDSAGRALRLKKSGFRHSWP